MTDTVIDLKTQAGSEFAHIFSEGARLSRDELVGLAGRLLRSHENALGGVSARLAAGGGGPLPIPVLLALRVNACLRDPG